MHEFSLMQNVLSQVCSQANEQKATSVVAINLVIGELTQVVDEAMEFALEALTLEDGGQFAICKQAKLNIRSVPAASRCSQCGHEFVHDVYHRSCVQCQSLLTKIVRGKEMYIEDIEVMK